MPSIGPIIVQLRPESPPCSTNIFHWCIIDFTEKGYVTRLRIADTILSELARPDDSRFSDHTFEKTILTVFDPEKTAPNDLYYLYINEERTLLRFRLKDQTPLKIMPGERYNGQVFLPTRPLLKADHLGFSNASHASFIEELASVKSPLLSQYQASSITSAPSDNAWLTERMSLTVSWDGIDAELRAGLSHGGFLSDWERLKNEATTSSDYCFALIALLQRENIQDVLQELNTNTKDNLSIIQHHLFANTLLQLHLRWLKKSPLHGIDAIELIYSNVMKLLYRELNIYRTKEANAMIRSFSEELIFKPIFTVVNDTSAERAHDIAREIYSDMKDPGYLFYTDVDMQRERQKEIISILERQDSHWLILKQLELIFDAENDLSEATQLPNLDQQLRIFSQHITNRRNNLIEEQFNFDSERTPLPIYLDTESRKNILKLILTTDDLVAALKGAQSLPWQMFLINLLNVKDPMSPFITTPSAFAQVAPQINMIKERTSIFKSRPLASWLALIHSIEDLTCFVDTLTSYQLEPLLNESITALNWANLLSCDNDLILLAQIVNTKHLTAILTTIPQTTLATYFQTPNALKSLLSLQKKLSNISCIIKSLPDQQRITAVSTLDKYTRMLKEFPRTKIYLTSLSVSNWLKLLEQPVVWRNTIGHLERHKRLKILVQLPRTTWLSILRFEENTIPAPTMTLAINDLYCCFVSQAKQLACTASISITDWHTLKSTIAKFIQANPSPLFFSTSSALHDTSWIQSSINITELKTRILSRFCQQGESENIDHYFKAVLCINAYETSDFCLGKRKLVDSADYHDQPPPSA